ncbi:hypothetical protein [Methylomonas sp. UP202]|uniref:hypothetical protein n=1 Tax=Methylomonas sp. UP202 TaxID=3040943 RepID=UPI00247A1DCD|nr:hypothetical protein [Methylomonas sp. UP202]WGS84773.1 hypothetical protein QC632_17145 [Methylomonas sp. UP202]
MAKINPHLSNIDAKYRYLTAWRGVIVALSDFGGRISKKSAAYDAWVGHMPDFPVEKPSIAIGSQGRQYRSRLRQNHPESQTASGSLGGFGTRRRMGSGIGNHRQAWRLLHDSARIGPQALTLHVPKVKWLAI